MLRPSGVVIGAIRYAIPFNSLGTCEWAEPDFKQFQAITMRCLDGLTNLMPFTTFRGSRTIQDTGGGTATQTEAAPRTLKASMNNRNCQRTGKDQVPFFEGSGMKREAWAVVSEYP